MTQLQNYNRIPHFNDNIPAVAEFRLKQFQYSGLGLIDKIKSNETVIDIGCGCNIFKKYIPNLIGIDPTNSAADYKIRLEDFKTDQKFDVAFCLGSIQFGDKEYIQNQIGLAVSLLKKSSRIYWRSVIAGNRPVSDTLFNWTLEIHDQFAKKFGFTVTECATEKYLNKANDLRLYAEWTR